MRCIHQRYTLHEWSDPCCYQHQVTLTCQRETAEIVETLGHVVDQRFDGWNLMHPSHNYRT